MCILDNDVEHRYDIPNSVDFANDNNNILYVEIGLISITPFHAWKIDVYQKNT